jgi:hypothetical protein
MSSSWRGPSCQRRQHFFLGRDVVSSQINWTLASPHQCNSRPRFQDRSRMCEMGWRACAQNRVRFFSQPVWDKACVKDKVLKVPTRPYLMTSPGRAVAGTSQLVVPTGDTRCTTTSQRSPPKQLGVESVPHGICGVPDQHAARVRYLVASLGWCLPQLWMLPTSPPSVPTSEIIV